MYLSFSVYTPKGVGYLSRPYLIPFRSTAAAANNSTVRRYTNNNATFTLKVPAFPLVTTALCPINSQINLVLLLFFFLYKTFLFVVY